MEGLLEEVILELIFLDKKKSRKIRIFCMWGVQENSDIDRNQDENWLSYF